MNNMLNIALISGIVFSTSTYSATEFPYDLVPEELAEAFVYGNIYSSLPDDFPTPTLPAGLDLYVVGSVENGPYHQQVLLGTSLSGSVLREILAIAYSATGWLDISNHPSSLRLCHDVHGMLEFRMAAATATANRVLVSKHGSIPMGLAQMTCVEQQAYQNGGPATTPYAVFSESMPELEVPSQTVDAGPTLPLAGISSSSGGSGYYFESKRDRTMTIEDITMDELEEHFALQLVAQGWQEDSDVVGVKSASSIWFKTVQVPQTSQNPATDMVLTGILILLNPQHEKYRVTFTLQAGEPGGTGIIGVY